MTIEFAPQDMVDIYEHEVDEVLRLLGHTEAFVTDESDVGDFICMGASNGEIAIEINKLQEAADMSDITMNTKIWRVAQAINKRAE